jgi:hypothetical protein
MIASKRQKIAVIDAVKLANEFSMKKELETIANKKLDRIGRQIDSVNRLVQLAHVLNDNGTKEKEMTTVVEYFKAKLEESFAESNEEINRQIWKRLNPMLSEFGKAKDLHLIIGANGMGSVLYSDGYFDMTDEALLFVNKQYMDGK